MQYEFRLQVDDIQRWAAQYLQCYASADSKAFEAGKRISSGERTRANLVEIVSWKSNRRADLIEKNSDDEIAEALRFATLASEPRSALAVLLGLEGVALPMASAILTALDQRRYTVVDYRAVQALSVPNADYYRIEFYVKHYLPECKRLAEKHKVDLRTLDRALWAWSADHDKNG